MRGFSGVLGALLSAWEDVKAAEAQRAQQEAELFKNKTQTSTFQTEEVSWSVRYGGSYKLSVLANPHLDELQCKDVGG